MSSNGSPEICFEVLKEHLIGHVLRGKKMKGLHLFFQNIKLILLVHKQNTDPL